MSTGGAGGSWKDTTQPRMSLYVKQCEFVIFIISSRLFSCRVIFFYFILSFSRLFILFFPFLFLLYLLFIRFFFFSILFFPSFSFIYFFSFRDEEIAIVRVSGEDRIIMVSIFSNAGSVGIHYPSVWLLSLFFLTSSDSRFYALRRRAGFMYSIFNTMRVYVFLSLGVVGREATFIAVRLMDLTLFFFAWIGFFVCLLYVTKIQMRD